MRQEFLLTLFVLAFAVPSVFAQDAAKVDSKHYKVEFENSSVRVLRVNAQSSKLGRDISD